LKDGVLVEGGINGKTSYSFTVLAFDGVNEATPLAVSVSLSDITQVTGAGIQQQGVVTVTSAANTDGSYTLSFGVEDSLFDEVSSKFGGYSFDINYSTDELDVITSDDFTVGDVLDPPTLYFPNDENPGVLGIGVGMLPEVSISASDSLGELVVNPKGDSFTISITFSSISANSQVYSSDVDTVVIFGDLVAPMGTSENETFVLNGGESEITGGDGIDAYVITATTGDQTFITDFMHEEDIIDMTQLLLSLDYTGLSEYDPAADAVTGIASEYEDTSLSVLDLIAQNDSSLDNVFGMVVNQDTGVITGFYDSNSDADVVEIETFEINIGSAVADVTLDDLTAGIGGFIA
jgi:hypothetical protein